MSIGKRKLDTYFALVLSVNFICRHVNESLDVRGLKTKKQTNKKQKQNNQTYRCQTKKIITGRPHGGLYACVSVRVNECGWSARVYVQWYKEWHNEGDGSWCETKRKNNLLIARSLTSFSLLFISVAHICYVTVADTELLKCNEHDLAYLSSLEQHMGAKHIGFCELERISYFSKTSEEESRRLQHYFFAQDENAQISCCLVFALLSLPKELSTCVCAAKCMMVSMPSFFRM